VSDSSDLHRSATEESRAVRLGSRFQVRSQPWLTAGVLALADLLALAVAMVSAIYIRLAWDGEFHPYTFFKLWPVLGLFLGTFGSFHLYFGISQSPADEIRRICQATFLVYLGLGAITYLSGTGDAYSRGVFVIALVLSFLLIPIFRMIVRKCFGRRSWWGSPCVIFGAGPLGTEVVKNLLNQPGLGLRPVAILDDRHAGTEMHGLPVLTLRTAELLADRRIPYAVVGQPAEGRDALLKLIEKEAEHFPHLVIVPDLYGFSSLWVDATDLGGILGLEVKRRLLMPGPRFIKRTSDLILTIIGGLLIALPLTLLFAALIKLDSRGPIFYGQTRLGRNGKHFTAWKFRSMVADADAALKAHLEAHPELREEWERDRKLKNDPRVTRMGRLLRKTSLDELPQLWNVLCGEMSLVGPRPIVDEEVEKYDKNYRLYTSVRPGLSGMWQVSGRSDTDYKQRVWLDAYYVRNWSVWLDAYILARTVKTVLLGKGAY
jgi:Undecaprenyl-phosphate galactose phosphotransferase WbaP